MSESQKITEAAPDPRGIKSFRDWRFYLVALLLSGSLLCIVYDPYFIANGEFVFRQGMVVLLLALTISAAFLWETPIFGKPAGANLLLQSFSVAPFALLVTRLCASDGKSSPELVLPKYTGFWNLVCGWASNLLSFIPLWIRDLFSNWGITLLFLFVLGILCLRHIKLRAGAITLVLILLFALQLNRDGTLRYLIAAALLLIVALSFMFSRYDQVSYYENIIKRLRRNKTIGQEELRTVLLVMEQLAQKKRLSDENFRQIVKDCYAADHPYSNNDLNMISGELAKRIIHNHGLAFLHKNSEGTFLFPNPLLFRDDNLLRAIAVVPRIIVVAFFALFWVIMPVDLIPDGVPLIGVFDDIAVMILSGVVIQSSSRPMRSRNE